MPVLSEGGRLWVGFDVGGQSVKGVLASEDGDVIARGNRPTGAEIDAEGLAEAIEQLLAELARHGEPERTVGCGLAGVMTHDGILHGSPNMPALVGRPVRDVISKRLGRPVAADNDANCAALAESWGAGAAAGKSYLLLTLGSGVGSGIVLDGDVYHGSTGYSCELGHMVVVHGGRRCGCGNRGCLEAYFSEAAARSLVDDAGGRLAETVEAQRKNGGGYAQALFELDDEGHEAAGELVSSMIEMLGSGIASAINVLDLTTIVLGGGIAPAVLARIAALRVAMDASLFARPASAIEVLAAAHGPDAGALGAACLARLSR